MLPPQNDQTHSNNSPAFGDELFGVFDHFRGLTLKGLMFWINGELNQMIFQCFSPCRWLLMEFHFAAITTVL